MNKPLVIGLGVAGVAVVGGIGYALYKRSAPAQVASKFPAMPGGTDPRFLAPGGQQQSPQPYDGPFKPAQPQSPLPTVNQQIFWADKSNATRTATSIADLRTQLVKEYGTLRAARLANVFIPDDKRAKPGGEWLPAAFYVFPAYLPSGVALQDASQLKDLVSGNGVPRAYAHAAGWARTITLQRQNGLGGAQMVSGRGGR